MIYADKNHETSVLLTSSAALELFWATLGVGAALLGIAQGSPLQMSAITVLAVAFALFARSDEIATTQPRAAGESDAVGVNVLAGLAAVVMGALALADVLPHVLTPLALMALAGLLVLDAPFELSLAAPRGRIASAYMALAGIAAVIVLAAAFSVRAHSFSLVPWAALMIASAQLIAASAVLLRIARERGRSAEHEVPDRR
jgi:hypothetical protein